MKRIRLRVAYDGTNYSGWQIQPNAPTIEKKLDEAIYALTGVLRLRRSKRQRSCTRNVARISLWHLAVVLRWMWQRQLVFL